LTLSNGIVSNCGDLHGATTVAVCPASETSALRPRFEAVLDQDATHLVQNCLGTGVFVEFPWKIASRGRQPVPNPAALRGAFLLDLR
jgi:hypothetical protein